CCYGNRGLSLVLRIFELLKSRFLHFASVGMTSSTSLDTTARSTAGPSTAPFAECANGFAQDDIFGVQSIAHATATTKAEARQRQKHDKGRSTTKAKTTTKAKAKCGGTSLPTE